MLSSISGGARVPESKIENISTITDYTTKDIENFFQIITNTSYDKTSYCAGGATLVRQNFLDFIRIAFFPTNGNQVRVQAKILVEQIDMLINKNVFKDILDAKILAAIKNDILNKGALLKSTVAEDDREEFVATLIRINAKARDAVVVPNNVPRKLQTGLTKYESDAVTYHARFFQSKSGIDLSNKGFAHFQKKEWALALIQFELAVIAENEIAEEMKQPVNETNLALYQKSIASSYNMIGLDQYNEKKYLIAIEFFKKTISIITALSADFTSAVDANFMTIYQRNLVFSYDGAASDFFFKGDIEKAIEYHQNAITEFHKISEKQLTAQDEKTVALYQRKLALVLSEQGNNFDYKKNLGQAIACYEKVEKILQEIKPDQRLESDTLMVNRMKDKIKCVRAKQANTYVPSKLFVERKKLTFEKSSLVSGFKKTPDYP